MRDFEKKNEGTLICLEKKGLRAEKGKQRGRFQCPPCQNAHKRTIKIQEKKNFSQKKPPHLYVRKILFLKKIIWLIKNFFLGKKSKPLLNRPSAFKTNKTPKNFSRPPPAMVFFFNTNPIKSTILIQIKLRKIF